jgi:hypothetical protein
MSEHAYITFGQNPPLTSEEMAAHLTVTAATLHAAGIPTIFITQEPRELGQIAGDR